ncbi:hypothetical protein, partial [Aliivibrio fischeri]|uniref:hypothetical protein n=1 Tax=Aliivibrio fischeri TaxID=668 RepID=UPI00355118B5
SSLPIYLASSFENTLGFSFIFLAFAFYIKNRKAISITLLAVSLMFHLSGFFFLLIFIIVNITYRTRVKVIIIITGLGLLFLLLLSRFEIYSSIAYLDIALSRLYKYTNGPWSAYIGGWEYLLLITVVIKIVFGFFILINIKRDNLVGFLVGNKFLSKKWLANYIIVYLLFSLYFINFRTLGLRYVYIGFLFLYPFVYLLIMKSKIGQVKKYLSFSFVIFCIFSGPNINYINGIKVAKFGREEYSLFLMWHEIYNLPLYMPYQKFHGLSRTQKVEAANLN